MWNLYCSFISFTNTVAFFNLFTIVNRILVFSLTMWLYIIIHFIILKMSKDCINQIPTRFYEQFISICYVSNYWFTYFFFVSSQIFSIKFDFIPEWLEVKQMVRIFFWVFFYTWNVVP